MKRNHNRIIRTLCIAAGILLIICIVNAAAFAAGGKITLNKTSNSLCRGVSGRDSFVLKAKLSGGLTGKVTFKSSDAAVAKVDQSGKVTALKKGTAVITASCGKVSASCKITVYLPGLKLLTAASCTLKEGWKYQIKVETAPKTTTVTYESSDKNVAVVSSDGLIKAGKTGTAVITIRSNGKVKTVKVKVIPRKPTVETYSWNSGWRYAANSRIHTGKVKLYHASNPKGIVVAVNAGHGTIGGESVRTLCHPDGSPKVTGGSTAAGSIYAAAVSSGTVFLDGTSEAAANLSLALILKDKLLAAGYDVLMIRETSDTQLDNIARSLFANRYADCHISIHYDSSASNKGFYYIGVPNVASYRAMVPVSLHWQKSNKMGECILQGVRGRSVKIFSSGNMPLDLTQTSYSTIPTLDLEVGDRASSHTAYTQTMIANGIVDGIKIYFGK